MISLLRSTLVGSSPVDPADPPRPTPSIPSSSAISASASSGILHLNVGGRPLGYDANALLQRLSRLTGPELLGLWAALLDLVEVETDGTWLWLSTWFGDVDLPRG
eukprot:3711432-Pyramimonas_sp.AAC.1